MDILSASIASWGDGVVVDSFTVVSAKRPSAKDLATAIEAGLRLPLRPRPVSSTAIKFDNNVLPWFTACTVEADDGLGVLAGIATAFAIAGVDVHSARISTDRGTVVDRFSLTDRDGRKLDAAAQTRVRKALEGEQVRSRRGTR
jgi:hypothetical protein